MNLPESFKDWCRSPFTKDAVALLSETIEKAQLDALVAACAHSDDPTVRGMWSRYDQTRKLIAILKGKGDERG